MAEKPKADDKSPAAPAAAPEKKGDRGSLLKSTPVLLGVVMVLEAGVLFGAIKFFSGPKIAHGDVVAETSQGSGGKTGSGSSTMVELSVLSFKAPNKLTGRTFLYDVSIFVSTRTENKATVEKAIKDREATIQDRIRTIIAQTDPEKLGGGSEPGLETLRRQVKYQLDELIGVGTVEEVLIPRCIPYRAEF
jgi:flagellar basal body-associated protein FliL